MNYKTLSIVVMGLLLSNPASSGSIYKCTKTDKTSLFTDKVCPADTTTTLVHQETEQDIQKRRQEEKISIIKRLIEGNQAAAAQEYAIKNNLSEVYYKELSIYANQKVAEEKQKIDEEKQQQLAIEQQKLLLQKQQLLMQKTQQQPPINDRSYYGYPYYGTIYQPPHHHPHRNVSPQISSGGMNPVSSGGMNPPMSTPSQITPQPPVMPRPDLRENNRRPH